MADEDPLIGRTIARKYVIESLIGRGGSGSVYRAHQQALGRPIALKVLHDAHLEDPTFEARFKREAKAASRLDHPNLTRVLDFGEEADGRLYIAMEFLEGRNLAKVIKEDWPLGKELIVDTLSQSLSALAAAHDAGVVHRDIKPDNIVLSRGKDDDGKTKNVVKLCDFGIVKMVAAETEQRDDPMVPKITQSTTLTANGTIVGTPEYMSPEQASAGELTPKSDLYSMGVVLYEMLTQKKPFTSKSSVNVMVMQISEPPKPPSQHVPDVDPALEKICLRAMEKDPAKRYASAREMRSELRAAIGMKESAAKSIYPPPETAPPKSDPAPPLPVVPAPDPKKPSAVVVALVVLLIALAMVLLFRR